MNNKQTHAPPPPSVIIQVLVKQSAATLLKDMLGSSLVATKRQLQNKAKAVALEELRVAAAQQVITTHTQTLTTAY